MGGFYMMGRVVFNPFIPGGNKKVTNKRTFLLPPGIKGLKG